MQQNSECKVWGDWDENINRMIEECSKLVQKEYKTTTSDGGDPLVIVQELEICI